MVMESEIYLTESHFYIYVHSQRRTDKIFQNINMKENK